MTRKVLLDANILIAGLDTASSTSDVKSSQAKAILTQLLSDDEVAIVTTPLIRYEVLRGIPYNDDVRYGAVKSALNQFMEIDIDRPVSELAADLFRLERHRDSASQTNPDKRKLDAFHVATADRNDLELESEDRGIEKLRELLRELPVLRSSNYYA